MNKEKLTSLVKYQSSLKERLNSIVLPEKHTHRPESYKHFLKNELRLVTNKIEAAKLEGIPAK